jgi:uncharacterized membrane protein YjfL (UPF0719 family)
VQQPPAPQGQSPSPYPYAVSPPTNTLAIISLVAGLASFVILPLFAAVVAVVTGHMARGQIRQSGESGSGLALAGLILGYVNVVLVVIAAAITVALIIAGVGLLAASSTQNH